MAGTLELPSSIALVEPDLQHHACRLTLFGSNSPARGDSWQLSSEPPPHLAPLVDRTEYSNFAARCNAILAWPTWYRSAGGWLRVLVRLLVPALYPTLL